MSATITLKSRLEEATKYIKDNFDPTVKGNYSHFYTGRTLPWDDEYSPNISTSSEKELYDSKFQRIYLKQIKTEDTILAIKRFDWKKDTIYSRADFNVDFTDYRSWVHPESPFYIINSEGNVYKCISNNYNGDSTVEPIGKSAGYMYLGDGYVWKFMFDLSPNIKDKFLTKTWIPVPYKSENKSTSHLDTEANAIDGDISYIHVDNGGDNYETAPIIEIRGDGTGAVATAIMTGESIDYIQLSNNGTGYTYANIHIFGNGNNGSATAMISPKNGHGSDANYELGSFYVEITTELIGDEDGFAPISGTYRNIGIVKNTTNKTDIIKTEEKYNTLSILNISDCSGTYAPNEMIIGELSYAQGIVYYDPSGVDKNINVYMIEGNFIDGENIHGQSTGEVGIYNEVASTITDVDILSGDIIYKENIIFITRREIQIEKFVFTIEF